MNNQYKTKEDAVLTPKEIEELELACARYGFADPKKIAAMHNARPGMFTTARTLLALWYRQK